MGRKEKRSLGGVWKLEKEEEEEEKKEECLKGGMREERSLGGVWKLGEEEEELVVVVSSRCGGKHLGQLENDL